MCRQWTLGRASIDVVLKRFRARWQDPLQGDQWQPKWRIKTTNPSLVIRQDPDSGDRVASLMQWGFVPVWSKDPKKDAAMKVNARAETIATTPAYRNAFQKRRCLVPADGWNEWTTGNDGTKQPWRIQLPDCQLMAFAGIWEGWQRPDGTWLHSYAIATCEPPESIAHVHDRMPVLLNGEDAEGAWIDPATPPAEALKLLTPYPGRLEAYPVTREVSLPKVEPGPHFAWPLSPEGQPVKPPAWNI